MTSEALDLVAYPDLQGRVDALERDGYVYFPKLLYAAEVEELRTHMGALTGKSESFDRDSDSDGGEYFQKSVNNAFNRDPFFMDYLDKPGVIELWEVVHGPDCHVIGMTSWITGPGRPDQKLHVDWLPIPLPEDVATDPRVKVPVFITTAHFYLDDMYEEMGPTKFVPGSHRAGRAPDGETEWRGVGEKSILNEAGDVVVFRSEVWHRGSANRTDQSRYLLQVHCANRMITQKFPPYLNRFQFDPEIIARATPRQRRLLGDHVSGNYA